MKNNIEIIVKSGLVQNVVVPTILIPFLLENSILFIIKDYDINGTNKNLHQDTEGKKYIKYDFSVKGS